MKTITITININSEEQKPLTIKSSIQEQINFHLKEKEIARQNTIALQKGVIKLRDEILSELNEKVGSEVWFSKETKEGYYYNELSFKDGIRRNTSYDDWNITIDYDTKEVVFGQIRYKVPIVENGLKIVLAPAHKNSLNWQHRKYYTITDLNDVHKYLEKDYLTYFTRNI
jgi:hypothetical protein